MSASILYIFFPAAVDFTNLEFYIIAHLTEFFPPAIS